MPCICTGDVRYIGAADETERTKAVKRDFAMIIALRSTWGEKGIRFRKSNHNIFLHHILLFSGTQKKFCFWAILALLLSPDRFRVKNLKNILVDYV